MKILIVVPKFNNKLRPQYHFPVGLANIKTVLQDKGYIIDVINLNHKWGGEDELYKYIKNKTIDIVLTGGLTAHYHIIKDIFQTAKRANPAMITIGGGGGFSSEPILFSSLTAVDYACIGEGEITICELVEALINKKNIANILGLVYKDQQGEYIKNPERSAIENLDDIPYPDYDGFDMDIYLSEQTPYDYYFTYCHDEPRMFPIFMGRSCPYQCNFCFHPLGNKYRQRSLDGFFRELDIVIEKYQINALCIFDELFSLQKARVLEFCERIKPYKLKWTVQMRVNIVNEQLLVAMRAAGCFNISYGLESISPKVLNNMNKKITRAEIEQALMLTYQCGIGIQGNFIFGDETEDMDTFSETLNFWYEHRKYQINLAFIETYPGTQLYKNSIQRGLIVDQQKFIESKCPIINMTKQPENIFKKMQTIVAMAEYHDCEIKGKVVKLEPDALENDFATVTLQCYHCGKINTIRRIPLVRVYSNNFKICCRDCNQKSVYDTRAFLNIRDSEFKYKLYFIILRQWMIEKEKVAVIEAYFKINALKTVAVLVDEEIAPLFYEQIKATQIKIAYIIDRQASTRYQPVDGKQKNISLSLIAQMQPVDAIIVTDIFEFKRNRQELLAQVSNVKIISLADVVLGINHK